MVDTDATVPWVGDDTFCLVIGRTVDMSSYVYTVATGVRTHTSQCSAADSFSRRDGAATYW